ncbi:MAG: TonB-dependent receptor [Acidobacteriota bacterium]
MLFFSAGIWTQNAVLKGQTDTASISGFVNDPSGSVVSGATVTALNVDTNARYRAVTNESGFYTLTPLRIGRYTLTAEHTGFKREVIAGIVLEVQQRAKVDFALQLGQITEQITVESQSLLLGSEETSLGQVVTNRSIVELPLNGRNYLQLSVLATGVVPAVKGKLEDQGSAFVANGLRYTMNNYLLDGVDNNSQIMNLQSGGAEITRPSIDAIQEFKMQTSNFSAEFGRSAGAVVNVTTRSGTNTIHGTAFEFHRNAALDARNFFDPPDQPIPPFIQNQFGATFGGPLVRDKTFFFGSWEGMRYGKGLTNISTVPTAAHRQGDFGARPMFDPASVRPNPAGAGFVRDLFPNNHLPRDRRDPVAARVIALYPPPTSSAAANNFVFNPKQRETFDQYDTRWDHRLSSPDTIYGRFSFLDRDVFAGPPLPLPAVGSSTDRVSDQLFTNRNLAVVHTHVFSPTAIHEFRFGFIRVRADLRPFVRERLSQEFGIRGVSTNPKVTGLASFQPNGFANLGDADFLPNSQGSQTTQFLESVALIRGNHSLKIGADIRLADSFFEAHQRGRGQFVFNGVYTQNPQSRGNTGNTMGDFLLGLASNGIISSAIIGTLRHRAYQFYLQDDWKVTPKLTVNAGIRWELITPFFEKDNRQGNFILEPENPGYLTVALAGSAGRSRALVSFDKNNIAPRLGLAYQLTKKTVIRAAGGVFYTSNELWGVVNRMVANAPFFLNASFPTDQIAPNLVVQRGFPEDSLSSRGQAPRAVSFNANFPCGYTQQWNFNIQRQLPSDVLLEAAYVGSNSVKLSVPRDVSQPRPGLGPLPPRRAFPQLGEVQRWEPMGNVNYQSLQVKAEKRYSSGLAFLVSYTLGKALESLPQQTSGVRFRGPQNNLDLSGERARIGNDARQRLAVSYTYDLPMGRHRRLGNSRLGDALLGGWELSGVTALQSGLPFTVSVGFDPSNTGLQGYYARPNRIGSGDLPASQRSPQRWFNVNDFVIQPSGTFGNAGRHIINGPGFLNFDLGLNKAIHLTEKVRLQFRSEFFNLFNTPQFDQPGGGTFDLAGRPLLSSANPAEIARTVHDARQIQFGLKLVW